MGTLLACSGCWPLVRESLLDGSFAPRFAQVLAPFAATAAILLAAGRAGFLDRFGDPS